MNLAPKGVLRKVEEHRKAARPWCPWKYQERALKAMLENAHFGLLLSPGMGKSSTTLAAIKILLHRKLIKRVLITAPLRAIYSVWPLELADWSDFHDLGFALLHGSDKGKVLRSLRPEHKICLINPEGFQWLTSSKQHMKLLDADMLVVDESSLWKSSQTQRFRCLRPHIGTFKRRYILTGSPRPKNYLDLHSQVFIMDRGAALGTYITHYRNRFFFPTGWELREWEIIPGKDKEINALIAPMVLRLDAEDYLKLPQVPPDIIHKVELPTAVRKQYDLVEEQLLNTLFDQPLTSSAGARSKCAQIANGAVYTDAPSENVWSSKRPVKVLHTEKVEALADLYHELQGSPLLVGVGFHHDVVAIRKALGFDVPCINGDTTKTQADDYIERWNKGKLDILLGHPASMGHALNLQGCNAQHVAFFDLPDSYDLFDQFFQRVRRQGNKATAVMRHLFVTTGTVDEAKVKNLKRKGSGQKAFLDAMREYAEQRRKK